MCEYEIINDNLKITSNISYNEIIEIIDRDIIRQDIFDLVKAVKKYSFARDALLELLFSNRDKLKRRIKKYLKKTKEFNYDKEVEIFYERFLDCYNGEKINFKMFDDLIYVTANDSIFFRFLCANFISTNDFLNIYNNTFSMLKEEFNTLTKDDFNDIFKVELFNSLELKF